MPFPFETNKDALQGTMTTGCRLARHIAAMTVDDPNGNGPSPRLCAIQREADGSFSK
jgi:hypothetical protein